MTPVSIPSSGSDRRSPWRVLRALALAAAMLAPCGLLPATAQEPAVPNLWDRAENLPRPDLAALPRLRFLTTLDHPPFSYLDASGRLSGFHVDLARAVCVELDILARCQIQGLPWAELEEAMAKGEGEAILAGLAPTAENRARYAFSRPYLQFPARFVAARAARLAEPLAEALAGRRVGVLAGSAHEAILRRYFPQVKAVTFSRPDFLYSDLRSGGIEAAFGDGMRLSFWLNGSESGACCRFVGGPYLAPEYLGTGLALAVEQENAAIASAFDYALRGLSASGRFAELYLRHFPVSFF